MSSLSYDVITVGSNTIDAFIYTDRVKSMSMKTLTSERKFICYPLGSKLKIGELDFYTGGGGLNVAVCLSRLGFKTGYIGKIGDDLNGKVIIAELEEEKIDFLGKVSPLYNTGYSIVLDSIEKNRTILTHRGANDHLKPADLDFKKLKTKWFNFSAMLDDSYQTLENIAEYAKENGIKICFNPNNYLCEKGSVFLEKVLKNTTILILNDEEALHLVKTKSNEEKLLALKALGPKTVIITNGSKPIYCVNEKDEFYTVYPLDIKIVEVTGAGDSFTASFLAGIIKNDDFTFALKLAIVNSHSILRHKGAKNILLGLKEAEDEISKSPIRIEKGIQE